MPSVSAKQAKLMSAIAHGWDPPMKNAPSMKVAQDFHQADKRVGKYMHADGGKITAARAALAALEHRLPTPQERLARAGSQLTDATGHDPYNSADDMARRATQAAEADKWMPGVINPESASWADGGAVDAAPTTSTDRYLGLIRHAADRASAAVSDDPHHALARVAAGLSSQIVGLDPASGGSKLGARPGLVDETLSVPAGAADLGTGVADLGGMLGDRTPSGAGATGAFGRALSTVRDALHSLQDKYGDLAPKWSRDAEARTGRLHDAVHRAMGLSDPKGVPENLAEAGGMMLGQLPLPTGELKEGSMLGRAGLKALKGPLEYLGPTVKPSLANYGAGTLTGGLMGAAGSPADNTPPPPALTQNLDSGPQDKFY